jgi:hypothetical protein
MKTSSGVNSKNRDSVSKGKKPIFELFTEIMGWIQIAAAPFLVCFAIALIIYITSPGETSFIAGIIIMAIGLCVGSIYATKKWKKEGTIHYISQLSATPDLDRREEEK